MSSTSKSAMSSHTSKGDVQSTTLVRSPVQCCFKGGI